MSIAAIVVNYNYARFLPDALDSVLAQTDPFDEVVVVNDGSTDNSLEVLARYPVKVIDKPNGGQLTASIEGLKATTSDYVYILDADDYLTPHFVERIRPCLGEAVKLQCQLTGVDGNREPLGSVFPTYPKGYSTSQMRQDNETIGMYIFPPTAGNVYKRSFLQGLDLSKLKPNEPLDGPPAMAAPYLGEVITIAEPLAYYRVHGTNDSRWDKPDGKLLKGEVDWFTNRWRDVQALSGASRRSDDEPLYVVERKMMCRALEGRSVWSAAASFVSRLWRTNYTPKQKTLLAVWAAALCLPFHAMRRKLVLAKRSPVNRPRVARGALLKFLR